MEKLSRKSCRLCLTETEFNVSLHGSYARRTNIVDKILVCLKIVIEENDFLNTICYRCAEHVERFYEYVMFVKKSQKKLVEPPRKPESAVNRRLITSYVREQVYDADFSFSFLEMPNNEEPSSKKETKPSSPFFSYFSPPMSKCMEEPVWKTPKPRRESVDKELKEERDKVKRQYRSERPRHHSRDLFESQSQDVEECELKPLDWKLSPDDSLLRRIRDKCFGRSDL